MTKQSLKKAVKDLYAITSNHAMRDYIQANFKNGKKKSKKHIPYSLSSDTLEAKELYNKASAYLIDEKDVSLDAEEELKAYLLPYRTFRTEYLISTEDKRSIKISNGAI